MNLYNFVSDSPINYSDALGLLAALVESIEYYGHGSAEKNGTDSQYVSIDKLTGQVPLSANDSRPGASITATLDDGFNASIVAQTALQGDNSITSLQMSTDLNGTIKVRCPCNRFLTVHAKGIVSAVVYGAAGAKANASFENVSVLTAWNKPSASKSVSISKDLDAYGYATFRFELGQAWIDACEIKVHHIGRPRECAF